jgi:diadenosine tetraphosphate (Ap4A) HIT family hydrolase
MTDKACPFCSPRLHERILLRNDLAFAVYDINPVSKGHILIIPFRHVAGFFETTPEEREAFLDSPSGSGNSSISGIIRLVIISG